MTPRPDTRVGVAPDEPALAAFASEVPQNGVSRNGSHEDPGAIEEQVTAEAGVYDAASEARYRVLLTDYSCSLSLIRDLVGKHTRIPGSEIDTVLRERPAVLADAMTRREAEDILEAFHNSGANLQVLARAVPGIEEALDEFLLASEAVYVLLMDRSGFKICERGNKQVMDVDRMLGLIAGVFAATKRIAQHLGEEDFSALFHPGDRASIHLSLVGDRGVLVTQFDKSTTMRIVRLYAAEAAKRISTIL